MLQNTYRLERSREMAQPFGAGLRDRVSRMNSWLRWRPAVPRQRPVLSVAELAECTCPEICNRDHANE